MHCNLKLPDATQPHKNDSICFRYLALLCNNILLRKLSLRCSNYAKSSTRSDILLDTTLSHITVCTVVQNCCEGDLPCQWKTAIFTPQGSQTPESIDIKLDRGDYIGDLTPHANFGISTLKGAGLHMRKIVIIRVHFLPPRYFLPRCSMQPVFPTAKVSVCPSVTV